MKRFLALLLAVLTVLSFASCMRSGGDGDTPLRGDDETSPQKNVTAYEQILAEYRVLLTAKKERAELVPAGTLAEEIEDALLAIVASCNDPRAMGYATKDLNGDGVTELILLGKDQTIYALFTTWEQAAVLLVQSARGFITVYPDGKIQSSTSVENQGTVVRVSTIQGGSLEGLEFGSIRDGESFSYYKVENGERTEITEQEMRYLENAHMVLLRNRENKRTGLRYVSAIAEQSIIGAYRVDFSTYDGILDAYKIMVESLSEYTETKWTNGYFDTLFAISDDDTYAIFHSIFYGAVSVRPTTTYYGDTYANGGDNAFGYAKKDLDGNGTAELLLMNDNYEIFAVFAEENGKAVLLDDLFGAWIDENGWIRKDKATGGLTGRDGECFVYAIDGTELKCLVGVGYKVNVYLEKEGWYRIDGDTRNEISSEAGETLYAQYHVLPSAYSAEEYMKTYAQIDFLPLFERATATQDHLKTYTNGSFAGGNSLTMKSVTDNALSFTLEIFKSVGEFPDWEIFCETVEGTATQNDNGYAFSVDGVAGRIELGVHSAWVIVTESNNDVIDCRAYLFDYPQT